MTSSSAVSRTTGLSGQSAASTTEPAGSTRTASCRRYWVTAESELGLITDSRKLICPLWRSRPRGWPAARDLKGVVALPRQEATRARRCLDLPVLVHGLAPHERAHDPGLALAAL